MGFKKNITILLILAGIAAGFYLINSGLNINLFLAGIMTGNPEIEMDELEIEMSEDFLKARVVEKGAYSEVAKEGEGITHLARKALSKYLSETTGEESLTPEHKIFVEDYIQKKTGDRWLSLGESVEISEDLIVEAINEAMELTPEQLENLEQFSAAVSF